MAIFDPNIFDTNIFDTPIDLGAGSGSAAPFAKGMKKKPVAMMEAGPWRTAAHPVWKQGRAQPYNLFQEFEEEEVVVLVLMLH